MIDFAELAVRVKYDDATKAAKALDDLTAAGQKAEQSTNRLGVSSVAQTRNMGAWAAIQAEATGHVGEHSIAIGRLERALASYVGHAVGAGSATESLVAGLLKFSVGTLETVGVLAGLAAVVGLYELMTSSSREAKKQMDDMTDSLVKQAEAAEAATLRGKENLELIAQINRQTVQKESGVGFRSVLMSLLTGKPTLDATDAQNQSTRAGRADTAAQQAAKDYTDAWAKGEEERTRKLAEEERKRDAIRREEERVRLAAERERGAEIAIAVDAQNQHRDDINAARRLNLVPQSAVSLIPGVGQLSAAEQKHMESVIKLDEEYKAAIGSFKSFHAVFDDFKAGLEAAATSFAQQFSPGAIAGNLLGKVAGNTSSAGGEIGGLGGLIAGSFAGPWGAAIGAAIGSRIGNTIQGLFGGGAAERTAQRQAADSAHAMALQIDEVTKALSGDQLGAAIDALQIQLISALQAINSALPGTKNEAERNRLRAEAAAQEQQQEARARHQDELNRRYAEEDLQVRNLRALGQGDAADRLAFQEQQQREMQKAIDDGRDATYLNTLATTQNSELLAFLNGTLQDAVRNSPSGFFASAYYQQFASPRSSPTDPFGTGMLPPNYPTEPPGTGAASGSGLRPPGSRGTPLHATVNVNVDGKTLTSVFIKNLDQLAASTGGAGSSRSDAMNKAAV